MKNDLGTVYLIHFSRPYKGTQHYIGWTGIGIEERMKRHNGERGACLLKACTKSGIDFSVVRQWENKDFSFEQLLKRTKNAKRFCPICNPEKYTKHHSEEV